MPRSQYPNVSFIWMQRVQEASDLLADILTKQQRRSDYDDLYFGAQEVMDILVADHPMDYGRSTKKGQIRKTSRRAYKKRKLSGWQKFIKANSKKPRFKLRSGKLNLKKMGIAYRKTAAYKRSKK